MPEYDEETKAKISGNNIGSNTCSSFIQRIKKIKNKMKGDLVIFSRRRITGFGLHGIRFK